MPSFAELVDLRPGKLKLAVDDWSALITKLKDLETDADTLDRKARQATWRGENAQVSKVFVTKTAKEFRDAVTQATSVRNILRDLHGQLTSAQGQLKALVEEAPTQGLHIDAQGTVRAASTPTNSVERENTPFTSITVPQDQRQNIDAMAKRIEKILETAAEEDRKATGALRLLGNEAHNFSSLRYRDLDAAERHQVADARKAVELAKKGADLTDRELSDLNALLRTHEGDPRFAEEFATRLGARSTLEFWANIADPPLTTHTADRTELLAALQNNLGHTLGSATESDSADMEDWEREIVELGDQRLGIDAARDPYGFQVMSSLMREGEYDSDFLRRYGEELVSFEHTQESETGRDPAELWAREARRFRLNLGDENDRGADPMVGFMEALGHSPEGATAFFNSENLVDIRSDDDVVTNFSYLTEERAWPPGLDSDQPSPGYASLGHALTAATLGYPYDDPSPQAPDQQGEAERAEVMKQVVDFYGANPEVLEEQEGIRESLTTIGAGRIDDLNYSMYNFGGSAELVDRDGLFKNTGPVTSLYDFGAPETEQFLKALATDEDAHHRLSAAQQLYTVSGLAMHQDDIAEGSSFAQNGAMIHGILDRTRTEEIIEVHNESVKERNLELGKSGEWRKYVVSALMGAGAGSVSAMMGPAAGVAAATLVPLAVDFGSNAVQTQYATHVMDQIEAEGGGGKNDVINSLNDEREFGKQRLMTPVSEYLKNFPFEQRRDVVKDMANAYARGRQDAERESLE